MSNLVLMRLTEGGIFIAYFIVLIWIARRRDPLALGAVVAGTLCFVFDWAWCARSFFNATFNPDLIPIPLMSVSEIFYPVAVAPAWGLAFGLPAVLLTQALPTLQRRFGAFAYVLIWIGGGVGMTLAEQLLTGVLQVYTYHQKPEFLIGTVPWSNILLSGNLMLLATLFFRSMQDWAALPGGVGFSLSNALARKGLLMGALPVWGAFVIAYVVQLFWYGAAEPWVESGRPF